MRRFQSLSTSLLSHHRSSFVRPVARYATSSQSQTPSAACCSTPPVVAQGYKEKGKFISVNGMKTYTTGPASASSAIFFINDIFGFFPQTLQGADILAHSDSERPYQVFMPDFFDGKPADPSWVPPDTEDKGKKLGEFFQTTAAPPKAVSSVPKAVKEIQANNPSINKWAVIGYCWGGKIVNLCSTSGTPFKAAAICHPAMLDPADAPNVTIPILAIPSGGEDKNDVESYQKALTVKNQVHWFSEQIHGFMTARSDLTDPKQLAAYESAYKIVLSFFRQHM